MSWKWPKSKTPSPTEALPNLWVWRDPYLGGEVTRFFFLGECDYLQLERELTVLFKHESVFDIRTYPSYLAIQWSHTGTPKAVSAKVIAVTIATLSRHFGWIDPVVDQATIVSQEALSALRRKLNLPQGMWLLGC